MDENAPIATHREVLCFQRAQSAREARAAVQRQRLAMQRPARVARRLALAHRIAEEIASGCYVDQADVARQHGLTRARLTQLMNLLLLAPDIQETLLWLTFPAGREPVSERSLRPVLRHLLWSEQRRVWAALLERMAEDSSA